MTHAYVHSHSPEDYRRSFTERRLSTATALTAKASVLADLAVERGLLVPCERCGTAGILAAYDRLTLICALNGSVTIDPIPTHLCVPTPPAPPSRRRLSSLVDMDGIADEVVSTWTA